MSETSCLGCNKSKTTVTCGICHGNLCKNCAEFLAEGAFMFLKLTPESLTHAAYCSGCYDETVAPALISYNEVLERAKNVYVFSSAAKKRGIPLLKRARERVVVAECKDQDETFLRLAFFAAELSFNALIDVDVSATKVRNEGYQKLSWKGVGVPALVDEAKLQRQDERERR